VRGRRRRRRRRRRSRRRKRKRRSPKTLRSWRQSDSSPVYQCC